MNVGPYLLKNWPSTFACIETVTFFNTQNIQIFLVYLDFDGFIEKRKQHDVLYFGWVD